MEIECQRYIAMSPSAMLYDNNNDPDLYDINRACVCARMLMSVLEK